MQRHEAPAPIAQEAEPAATRRARETEKAVTLKQKGRGLRSALRNLSPALPLTFH